LPQRIRAAVAWVGKTLDPLRSTRLDEHQAAFDGCVPNPRVPVHRQRRDGVQSPELADKGKWDKNGQRLIPWQV
jgi:hypothetical protein